MSKLDGGQAAMTSQECTHHGAQQEVVLVGVVQQEFQENRACFGVDEIGILIVAQLSNGTTSSEHRNEATNPQLGYLIQGLRTRGSRIGGVVRWEAHLARHEQRAQDAKHLQ